jgi:hypothetical protein
MSSWFTCRNISSAAALVRQGYEYVHHTSSTLGPDGTVKFPDGTPYAPQLAVLHGRLDEHDGQHHAGGTR